MDAITHVHCYVYRYSVLSMQRPQHYTCKTKQLYRPHTNVNSSTEVNTIHIRPVTSLRHYGGRRVFWEDTKFFNLCQQIFTREEKYFQGRTSPSLVTGLIQMIAKWFQPWITTWHRDKYAVDSQLVLSKYSYLRAHRNKPSSNRLVTTDYSDFVVAYGHFVIVV